jgi:hypothetical protein
MSDIQIALLILGLTIVLFMIIYNWMQLKKAREQQKRADDFQRSRDPLFERNQRYSEIDDFIDHDQEASTSVEFLKKNLPDEINMKFESVVSLTSTKTYEASILIEMGLANYLTKLRLGFYLRKENDLWATGDALDETFIFDQILITIPLISRRLEIDEEIKNSFLEFIEQVREKLNVNQIWISNEDILDSANSLKSFKDLINKNVLIKIQPKTDSSFHNGAFRDFFGKSNIRLYKDFHWVYNPKIDGDRMFKVMSLNRHPLKIESDSFIQGLVFALDIPTTANVQDSFDSMASMINEFCIKLNAVMVDSRNKEIDQVYIAAIKKHIDEISYEMKKNGLSPGSDQAIKYFS